MLAEDGIITSSGLIYTSESDREKWSSKFLFHTKKCYQPFVIFDLHQQFFVEKITVNNRIDTPAISLRAEKIEVFISTNLVEWHAKKINFDGNLAFAHSEINENVRYLKLSLPDYGILHLNSVILVGISDPILQDGATLFTEHGYFIDYDFHLTYNSGFFSMCSIAFRVISKYYPDVRKVVAKHSFYDFKDSPFLDIWPLLFSPPSANSNVALGGELGTKYFHHSKYDQMNFSESTKVIQMYFELSNTCKAKANFFLKKYEIDFNKIITVCYRGTDKHIEISPTSINSYISHIDAFLSRDPTLRIFIQTDQKQVRDAFIERYPNNSFFIEEMPVTTSDVVMHKLIKENKELFAINLLAVTWIMSKSRFLITHTGNVAYWSILFRGNCEGVIQL